MKTLQITFVLLIILIITQIANYSKGEMFRLSKLSAAELLILFPPTTPSIEKMLIKPIPAWWQLVPFLHSKIASSLAPLSPFVFVPKDIFAELQSESLTPEHIAILTHEFTHHHRLKNASILQASQYLVSRRYRIHEELHAISAEMHYRATQGLDYDIERKAKHFAGPVYLWAGDKKTSSQVFQKLWPEMVQNIR